MRVRRELRQTYDAKKRSRIEKKAHNLSVTVKKRTIRRVPTAKKRNGSVVHSDSLALNSSGNRTGMHNSEEPERMSKVRAMRKIYNKQMPVLACNSCAFQNACPKFRAGYECAFLPFIKSHNIDSDDDLIEAMKNLLTAGMTRTHLALTLETLTGGAPTVENSEAISMLFNQMKDMHEVLTEIEEEEVEFSDTKSITGQVFGNLSDFVGSIDESLKELNSLETTQLEAVTVASESAVSHSDPLLLKSSSQAEIIQLAQEYETSQLDSSPKSDLDKFAKRKQDIVVVSVGTRKKESEDGSSGTR